MSLCVGVCRHVSAGCFFVSIYVDIVHLGFPNLNQIYLFRL